MKYPLYNVYYMNNKKICSDFIVSKMVNVYRNKNYHKKKKNTVKNIKQLCLINDLNVYVFIIT